MYRGIGILSKGVSACMQPAAHPSSPRDNRLKHITRLCPRRVLFYADGAVRSASDGSDAGNLAK